jgi:hypothetical protein
MRFGTFNEPAEIHNTQFATYEWAAASREGWPLLLSGAMNNQENAIERLLPDHSSVEFSECSSPSNPYWDQTAVFAGDPRVRESPCHARTAKASTFKEELASRKSDVWLQLIAPIAAASAAQEQAQSLLLARIEDGRRGILYVNSKNVTSLSHFDTYDNLHTVVEGTKRFLLSPPADYVHYHMFPFSHPHVRQTQVHFKLPTKEFRQQVRVVVADVSAGEALFVPAGWMHQVHSITRSIAISVVSDTSEFGLYNAWLGSEEGLLPLLPTQQWKRWKQSRLGFFLLHFLSVFLGAVGSNASINSSDGSGDGDGSGSCSSGSGSGSSGGNNGSSGSGSGISGSSGSSGSGSSGSGSGSSGSSNSGALDGASLIKYLVRHQFSEQVRAELGAVPRGAGSPEGGGRPGAKYPCHLLSFEGAAGAGGRAASSATGPIERDDDGRVPFDAPSAIALATESSKEATRRFRAFNETQRPLYLLPYIENLALLMGRKWGLAFLEDCVLPRARKSRSSKKTMKRKRKKKKREKAQEGER